MNAPLTPDMRIANLEAELAEHRKHVSDMFAIAKRYDETLAKSAKEDFERLNALEHRIEKLERNFVRLEGAATKYARVRIARDNQMDAKLNSIRYDINDLRERMGHVEAKAFADVSEVTAVVGKAAPRAESDALDRRPKKGS